MSRITGCEEMPQVPSKVLAMYTAVMQLIEEGADVANIRVSSITEKAGIGKGTAYEYFDTKEEIVACAIVFQMQRLMGSLERELDKKESFREKLEFILEEMGQKDGRQYCFLRFLHMLTDSSELSKLIREKIETEGFAAYHPMTVLEKMIADGVARGELCGDLPMEYMVYSIFSRMITYMMTITVEKGYSQNAEKIRPYIYDGVMRDLGI